MSIPKFLINAFDLSSANIEKLRQELYSNGRTVAEIRLGLVSKTLLQFEALQIELNKHGFQWLEISPGKGRSRSTQDRQRFIVKKRISTDDNSFREAISLLKEIADMYNAELLTVEIVDEDSSTVSNLSVK